MSFPRSAAIVIGFVAISYVATWFSYRAAVGGWISVWWLPAGLGVAAAAAFGWRMVPFVYLGPTIYEQIVSPIGENLQGSIGTAVLLTVLYGGTGILLSRWFYPLSATVRDMAKFLLIAAGAAVVMGVCAVTWAQCVGGLEQCPPSAGQIFAFAAGDGLAIPIFVPLLLGFVCPPLQQWSGWSAAGRHVESLKGVWPAAGRARLEFGSLLLAIVVVGVAIELLLLRTGIDLISVVFVPAFFLAIRFGVVGAAVAVPLCSFIIQFGTAVQVSQPQAAETQFRVGALAVATLLIAAIAVQQQKSKSELLRTQAALKVQAAELETIVDERTAALQRSNEDLRQFAYIASHDLQAPMRTVAGFLELFMQSIEPDLLTEEQTEMVNRAVDGSIRMQRLIKDLLIYSRIDSPDPGSELVSLADVTSRVVALLNADIAAVGAKVRADDGGLWVSGFQMQQILQNLIQNALTHAAAGRSPDIAISYLDIGDGYAEIKVSDNGPGIDSKFQRRVFEMFMQIEPGEGSGMGLAIVQRIVKLNRGKIWIESDGLTGTTFHFTLPNEKRGLGNSLSV